MHGHVRTLPGDEPISVIKIRRPTAVPAPAQVIEPYLLLVQPPDHLLRELRD
ncbi:hypothetical protein [Streptomyces sp. NPDC002324]